MVCLEGATAFARFDPQPEYKGPPNYLHGGLAATVLDHVCAKLAMATLGGAVATGTLDLRYRKPVRLDTGPYSVVATADRSRRGSVRIHGRILDGIDTATARPLVEAKGLFIKTSYR